MDSKKKYLSTSLLMGFCLYLLSTQGCESSTGYSNDWTDTIVVNDRYYRLQLLNPDTGETVIIRDSEKVHSGLRWSPDGQFIAYSAQLSQGAVSDQIYVTDRFGRGKRLITLWDNNGHIEETPGFAEKPIWSPDGKFIAFCRYFDPYAIPDIYIATSNPSKGLYEVCLTPDPFADWPYDWTPDGSKILFGSNGYPGGIPDPDGRSDLYLMNINGSGKYRVIESDSSFSVRRARYSPDGTQIAFIALTRVVRDGIEKFLHDIYIINADGLNLRKITDTGINKMCVSWAPDGVGLAYTAGEEPWDGDHIFTVNVDGTDRTQITSGEPIYFYLDWRPSE